MLDGVEKAIASDAGDSGGEVGLLLGDGLDGDHKRLAGIGFE